MRQRHANILPNFGDPAAPAKYIANIQKYRSRRHMQRISFSAGTADFKAFIMRHKKTFPSRFVHSNINRKFFSLFIPTRVARLRLFAY